jgi:hypothetical protein
MRKLLAKLTLGERLFAANFVLMVLLQVLVKLFAGDAGFIACLTLWYIVYPLYCLFYGWKMGVNLQRMIKYIPIPALLFLPTVLVLFGFKEVAFYLYFGIYLAGTCFAAVSHHFLKMFMK